jgi:hypothetical protein
MPKAVVLYSFKKGDTSTLAGNLTKLAFNRKDGRRTIYSKEFSLDEVDLNLKQLKAIKDSIAKNATVMIASPSRVWREAFKAAGIGSEEATMLAGLAMSSSATTSEAPAEVEDMEMDAEAAPIRAELRAEESQAEGIVEDDFDVDALVSGLANAKLGGRRRKTRKAKKSKRRYSRRAPSLG